MHKWKELKQAVPPEIMEGFVQRWSSENQKILETVFACCDREAEPSDAACAAQLGLTLEFFQMKELQLWHCFWNHLRSHRHRRQWPISHYYED